ncbi:uncharacterized protein LOC135209845 [Macrobrachium nipponense]|uniref:uncharacterized protein LOC135209845 n=1 Tax=Macrobrachium nipponense TaxID=159736 RepID=UPI0030C7A48B
MNEWLRVNKYELSVSEQMGLGDRQLVLVECGRKRKNVEEGNGRKKGERHDKGVSVGVQTVDKACSADDFEGVNETYSICRFELTGKNSILRLDSSNDDDDNDNDDNDDDDDDRPVQFDECDDE